MQRAIADFLYRTLNANCMLQNFSGLKSILSGPAGGVVGYALTSWDKENPAPVIG